MKHIEEKIQQSLAMGLPAEEAHFEMAPVNRKVRLDALKTNSDPRLSAVMILLWEKDQELHTTLILRNSYKGVHSAQVSFPGGKKEDFDSSLEETAIRETSEEVGINNINVIGSLSDVYIPPSGFLVSPYIGSLNNPPSYNPDQREVNMVFDVAVRDILNPENVKVKPISMGPNLKIQAPYFDLNDQVVWGATAMILSEFKVVVERSGIF